MTTRNDILENKFSVTSKNAMVLNQKLTTGNYTVKLNKLL